MRARPLSVRKYKPRSCVKCKQEFIPRGPQRTCTACNICEIDGCTRKVHANGVCGSHASVYKRSGAEIPRILPRGILCGVDACERKAKAKGYCILHYDRVRSLGQPGSPQPLVRKSREGICSVEGCHSKPQADALCLKHYARRAKYGDPGPAENLRRSHGEGSITQTGYKKIVVDGKSVFEHRHVMEQMLGRPLRKGENVHHVNGQKIDNREQNLQLWSTQQPSGQRIIDKARWAVEFLRAHPTVAADLGVRIVLLESAESTEVLDSVYQELTVSDAICGIAGLI